MLYTERAKKAAAAMQQPLGVDDDDDDDDDASPEKLEAQMRSQLTRTTEEAMTVLRDMARWS